MRETKTHSRSKWMMADLNACVIASRRERSITCIKKWRWIKEWCKRRISHSSHINRKTWMKLWVAYYHQDWRKYMTAFCQCVWLMGFTYQDVILFFSSPSFSWIFFFTVYACLFSIGGSAQLACRPCLSSNCCGQVNYLNIARGYEGNEPEKW